MNDKIVGLSISQWLPCPLAIWNLLLGVAILLTVLKSNRFYNLIDFICRKGRIQIMWQNFFKSLTKPKFHSMKISRLLL